jgi:hypothetical protein
MSLFPEHKWDTSKLQNKPRNYWKSKANQQVLLTEIGRKLGIKDAEAWYNVGNREFIDAGGEVLLQRYGTFPSLISTIFDEHLWDMMKFRFKVSALESHENQKMILLKIGSKLGISETDFYRWYKVSTQAIYSQKGRPLLEIYGNSVSEMLKGVFPEHLWDDEKFHHRPQQFWHSMENQRRFVDQIAIDLKYKPGDRSEFYKLSVSELIKRGGAGLLGIYGNSIIAVLKSVYPEYPWLPWMFQRIPKSRILSDTNEVKSLIRYVEERLQIREPSGWYRVTRKNLKELGLTGIILRGRQLLKLLLIAIPDHNWRLDKFHLRRTRKSPTLTEAQK